MEDWLFGICATAMVIACSASAKTAPEPLDSSGHGREVVVATAPSDAGVGPVERQSSVPQVDGSSDADRRCIHNEKALQWCRGRRGFAYGPRPLIYCRGLAPRPGELEKYYEAIRNSPCVCNDLPAIAKRWEKCGRRP